MDYINRNIEKTIVKFLDTFRVVGITGPRQSGKSTTIKHLLQNKYEYLSFDKFNLVSEFKNDPDSFMKKYNKYVIFDEVQNVPELFNMIKIIVDDEPDIKGRFVLTGSAQFTLNKNISESLAGRIGLLSLLPFDFTEMQNVRKEFSVFDGCYPEIVMSSYLNAENWFDSYVKTYVERDLRMLQNIGDLNDFQRFLVFISSYAGKQLNMSAVSKHIGISVTTVKRWLSVLEASYIIFFLAPYHGNFGKRITKTPKLYFYDTGLAVFLMGLYGKLSPVSSALNGQLFENYIVSEIQKKRFHMGLPDRIYYYRTSGGREADVIFESGNKLYLAEIKYTSVFNPVLLRNLKAINIPADHKYIIYNGDSVELSESGKFINYKDFLNSNSFKL
ncbi:MAG: ATP-binding protein [Ignavibacteria bacterium]|nr:ATP-binding protein [Ignavibacteria bacterium]